MMSKNLGNGIQKTNNLNPIKSHNFVRKYPGRYKVGTFVEGTSKPDGSALEKHEATHSLVYDTKINRIVAINTSCRKNGFKVSDKKIDGTYIEKKTAGSNKPFLDDFGYPDSKKLRSEKSIVNDFGETVPDPTKGGQYMQFLRTHRKPGPGTFIENIKGTKFIEQESVDAIVTNEISKLPNYEGTPVEDRTFSPALTDTK